MSPLPSIRSLGWLALSLAVPAILLRAFQAPEQLTAQEDHQRMMDLLHITSLRKGADGSNPDAPNAANYDESKANPYPSCPTRWS